MSEEKIGLAVNGHSDEGQRAVLLRWAIAVGLVALVGLLAAYTVLYFGFGVHALLRSGIGILLGAVCLGVAIWQIHQGELDRAVYLALTALVLAYGFNELAWRGGTLFNLIGGLLLIASVGSLFLRHRRPWLIAAAVHVICVLAINVLPVLRADVIAEAAVVYYLDLGATILLSLVAFGLFVRFVLSGTIRTRLLAAFVSLILALSIVISAVSAVASFSTGQQQAFGRLESVAALKEVEIDAWVRELEVELDEALTEEEANILQLLRGDSPEIRSAAYADLEQGLNLIRLRGVLPELFVMDVEGNVILSTDKSREGLNQAEAEYFNKGLQQRYTEVAPTQDGADEFSVFVARPVAARDVGGTVIAVLVGRANLQTMDTFMRERAGLAGTDETYLVSEEGILLGGIDAPSDLVVGGEGIEAALAARRNISGLYQNYAQQPVAGVYEWISELESVLAVEQRQSEAFGAIYGSVALSAGVALLSVLLAIVVSLLVTRSIAGPLSDLTETATQIAAGDLDRVAEVKRQDEIGVLARTFNEMTTRLRGLIGGLEDRVAERTHELEARSNYLQASADVARAASSILDAEQLIRQVVELIRDRFDLYYVGLFLREEISSEARMEEWAVLRAGTGEAGRSMLARGHRIRVGEGMIGWSIANAQARVASEVDEDGVRLVTRELPETRSEAALPLRARGKVIGALTVQSTQPSAFDQETLAVFQTMADQVAIALENARLFAESQEALEAASRAYGELSREAWAKLLRTRPDMGYCSDEHGISLLEGAWGSEALQALREKDIVLGNGGGSEDRVPLAVPIKVRDEVIGVLDTYKPAEQGGWTDEELTLLEALANQLGEALEGARLYRDTQRRAARERLTRELADRMRRASDMDHLMQITLQEAASVLGASGGFIQLAVSEEETDVDGE